MELQEKLLEFQPSTEETTFNMQYIKNAFNQKMKQRLKKKFNSQALNTITSNKILANNIESLQQLHQPFPCPIRSIYIKYNQTPRTFAHPKGDCFKCGKPGHHAKTCGKWCELQGSYGHNTEEIRDKLSNTCANSVQQPSCAKIQKTATHFSNSTTNLNALE